MIEDQIHFKHISIHTSLLRILSLVRFTGMNRIKKVLIKNPKGICPSEIQIMGCITVNHKSTHMGIENGKHHVLRVFDGNVMSFPTAYLIEDDKEKFVEFGLTIQMEKQAENINLSENEFEVIYKEDYSNN